MLTPFVDSFASCEAERLATEEEAKQAVPEAAVLKGSVASGNRDGGP